jgi:uncharacterized protein
MSMFPNQQTIAYGRDDTDPMVKLKFFHQVYGWMAVGLLLTAVVSYVCAMQGWVIRSPRIAMAAALGAFAISWFTGSATLRLGAGVGIILFLLYSTLIGISISAIWLVYNGQTMVAAFGLTGGIFLITSLLGFILKVDLSKLGLILGIGAIGLFLASLINIWIANDTVSWFITYAVVVVFTGLMVVKTQELNEFAAHAGENPELAGKVAILGALSLYIAFINIFLAVLRILGKRD